MGCEIIDPSYIFLSFSFDVLMVDNLPIKYMTLNEWMWNNFEKIENLFTLQTEIKYGRT